MKDFTRAGYQALLAALMERGYESRRFTGAEPARRHVILRHDIDLWPESALALARIEGELGMRAAYFFLMRSPLYDAGAPECRALYKELVGMGHEIGLHFDAALLPDDPGMLEREARCDCDMLSDLVGLPVDIVSFHRPRPSLLTREAAIAGRPHTYQRRYFREIGYCSDSRGRWRHGHPLENEAVAQGRAIQLLTHPIWWAHDDAGDSEAALRRLVAAKGPHLKPAIAATVTGYDPESGRLQE